MNSPARPAAIGPMHVLGILGTLFLLSAPWSLPLVVNEFWVTVLAEILIWSLFATSVNILFGYTGLLSFGQALYFGMGAYGVALGIDMFGLSFWPAFLLGLVAGTLTAVIAGILAVRLTWHYFAIITIVFSLIFYFWAVGWKDVTGGDDGLPFSVPPVFKAGGLELTVLDLTFQYYFILVIVGACYWLLRVILKSPLGFAFMAVRENDSRASLIGLNPYQIRYISFVLAGFYAGMAGVLFAVFSRYASAGNLFWTVSGEGVIWTIIGGAGTLIGPGIGAALLIVIREELSVYWEHYLLIVGALVIVVVTFMPQGVMGLLQRRLGGTRPTTWADTKSLPDSGRENEDLDRESTSSSG